MDRTRRAIRFRTVRANRLYTFHPVGMDMLMPGHYDCEDGDTVRVVHLHGCPAPGVMGQCNIADPISGELLGMVCVNSLRYGLTFSVKTARLA